MDDFSAIYIDLCLGITKMQLTVINFSSACIMSILHKMAVMNYSIWCTLLKNNQMTSYSNGTDTDITTDTDRLLLKMTGNDEILMLVHP